MSSKLAVALLSSLRFSVEQITREFELIPQERKEILKLLGVYIQEQLTQFKTVNLNFICTHNSRRSHMAQVWAQTAACYYGFPDVKCFSGGTETTAFNVSAVKALSEMGFDINKVKDGDNPVYEILFSNREKPIIAFSKQYDDSFNPAKDFAAIMTCSHADDNCPLVIGASARFAVTYDDPKEFDGTPQEEEKYMERVIQIGREMFYAFSLVKYLTKTHE